MILINIKLSVEIIIKIKLLIIFLCYGKNLGIKALKRKIWFLYKFIIKIEILKLIN